VRHAVPKGWLRILTRCNTVRIGCGSVCDSCRATELPCTGWAGTADLPDSFNPGPKRPVSAKYVATTRHHTGNLGTRKAMDCWVDKHDCEDSHRWTVICYGTDSHRDNIALSSDKDEQNQYSPLSVTHISTAWFSTRMSLYTCDADDHYGLDSSSESHRYGRFHDIQAITSTVFPANQ
jgi:hypothetical protein